MNSREIKALQEAAERPGGWALFMLKTTEALAEKGYFERAKHSMYGECWRITEAGRSAFASAYRKDSYE